MGEGFRTFDHTGDLGLEVWADSRERLFALSAEALLAQVAVVPAERGASRDDPSRRRERVELTLDGDDSDDLFVHWLNTALLEADRRRAIWTSARVTGLEPRGLSAVLEGPRLDPAFHTLLREVKAVSHHYLELGLEPPRLTARMVLDL